MCEVGEDGEGHLACHTSDIAGGVQGTIVGVSEDGAYAYYVAGDILYEAHDASGAWHDTRVAQLSGEDDPDWANGGDNLSQLTARVSPNGEWVAFMSNRDLVGYDTQDAHNEHFDEELYLFDAADAASSRARPANRPAPPDRGGIRPGRHKYGGRFGPRSLENRTVARGRCAGIHDRRRCRGALSAALPLKRRPPVLRLDDGLVPQDINGTWDVYEYEPQGVPQGGEHPCAAVRGERQRRVQAGPPTIEVEGSKGEEGAGCVGLISSGRSPQESVFMDADEGGGPGEHGKAGTASGNEVFFMTTAPLTSADFDKSYDVYDAHECTATSPCIPPPPAAGAECVTAEACRAAPNPEPGIYGAPASATFNGIGDLPAPKTAVVKKTLTRAQKLAAALKVCKRDKKKAKRAACEKTAHKKFRSCYEEKGEE